MNGYQCAAGAFWDFQNCRQTNLNYKFENNILVYTNKVLAWFMILMLGYWVIFSFNNLSDSCCVYFSQVLQNNIIFSLIKVCISLGTIQKCLLFSPFYIAAYKCVPPLLSSIETTSLNVFF